jgi:EmrB/QacA subfamily drug resistance transporter
MFVEYKQGNIKLVVLGLLLGILMSAMDNTIVATAMGTIVSELKGLEHFIWVTSAYMIAVLAGMPIFGKLSDMYGRKRFYMIGLILFLTGSALCGMANSIVQLASFRAIQGIGGGALLPIAFTIIYDIFPPEKRGKMTGLFGAVFGLSSVFGPFFGAYITEFIGWRWVFYINLPFGLISLYLITRNYHEMLKPKQQKIDWLGIITLLGAIIPLMFALELGGKMYDWDSLVIVSLLGLFLICLILFIFAEKKASDPIIPFYLFKRRLFASTQVIGLIYGGIFVTITVYIPIFVQGVYGASPTTAGHILTPMMLASVVGSQFAGQFASKISFRNLMSISIVFFITGVSLLGTIDTNTPKSILTIYIILSGIGVGFSFSLLGLTSMHKTDISERGAANASMSFFRSLGMTLGITIFGSFQTKTFSSLIEEKLPDFDNKSNDPSVLFSPEMREIIPTDQLEKIVAALADSISDIYKFGAFAIIIAGFAVSFMGTDKLETTSKIKEKN